MNTLPSTVTTRKWWVLFATALSCVLVGIDYTIVNTCLPNIQREFHFSVNALQWLITGFGLTFSTLLIGMGRLGDLFGYRKILYIGIIGFTLSSLGAGLCTAGWQMIVMRLLQGFFGAMLFPASISLTSLAFPATEQGRALGLFGSLLGLGMAIGPVLGGVLTHYFSWRWIFFVNIPIALASLLLCMAFVKESATVQKVKMDWAGLVLLIVSLGALILAMSKGQEWGWLSPSMLGLWAITLISFMLFLLVENKTAMPLLPFSLMKNNYFWVGNLIFIVSVSFSWVVVFLVPLYLQNLRGYTALTTGLTLLFMTAMVAIMPAVAGQLLDKKGIVKMTRLQFIIALIAFLLLLTLSLASTYLWIVLILIFAGCAWGMGNGLGMPIALSGLKDPGNAGVLSGVTTTNLNIFAVIALSIATAIFRHGEAVALATAQYSPAAAFMHGFHLVFAVLAMLTVLLGIIALTALRRSS